MPFDDSALPRLAELDYIEDSAPRFEALLDLPWSAFLDSQQGRSGRFDILTASPFATLTTRAGETRIEQAGKLRVSRADPFHLVHAALGSRAERVGGLPFAGGAVGYFGYDLARCLEKLPEVAVADSGMPDMAIGIHDWAVVVDHALRRSWLVGADRDPETARLWPELLERMRQPVAPTLAPFRVLSPVRSSLDQAAYARAFARIKQHIRDGDCYQVNFAQRFEADVEGHPWLAYRRLRRLNPAPFSAFLGLPDGAVLSSSPERFVRVRDGAVVTQPIKGTRARLGDPEADRNAVENLRASAKDRAENVMIVDLLRNDIGKSCKPGSVRVLKLHEVKSFARVHHLVSTIEGQLHHNCHALDLLRGAFPGGSITGAPKVRAMAVIEALEPQRRGVYCGAIGYVGFDGNMDTNIAIRTLVQHAGRLRTWAGGGIVADSVLDAEYQECFDKAAAMLELLRS